MARTHIWVQTEVPPVAQQRTKQWESRCKACGDWFVYSDTPAGHEAARNRLANGTCACTGKEPSTAYERLSKEDLV